MISTSGYRQLRQPHWLAATALTAALTTLLTVFLLALAGCGSQPVIIQSVPDRQAVLLRRMADVLTAMDETEPGPSYAIDAGQLMQQLANPDPAARPFMVDVRTTEQWLADGHIDGAVNIPLQQLAADGSLAQLPAGRLIVCIGATAETSGQAAVALRWLGYQAVALQDGMCSWTQTRDSALQQDTIRSAIANPYPLVNDGPPPPVSPIPFRPLGQPAPDDLAILKQAAVAALSESTFAKTYMFDAIFAKDLNARLQDPVESATLFVLDIRPPSSWTSDGHIAGASHIEMRQLADPNILAAVPHDRLIAVVDTAGQRAPQVTLMLRMLGYDAVSLQSGLTSWAEVPVSTVRLAQLTSADNPVVR